MDLASALYEFLRGGIGVALIVAGIALNLAPHDRSLKWQPGALLISIGFLFSLSALDPVLKTPADPGNALILLALWILSQAFLEIALFVFGDEKSQGTMRVTFIVGLFWAVGLWVLALFDPPVGTFAARVSVEDGQALGPLHNFVSWAMYAWPLALVVLAVTAGRYNLRDLKARAPGAGALTGALLVLLAILTLILTGVIAGSVLVYRLGHTLLELAVVAGYLVYVARPELFVQARENVKVASQRALILAADEELEIRHRLEKLQTENLVLQEPGLDLADLARRIGVPAYRLSFYFNGTLEVSFSSWLNQARITRACERMLAEPDRAVLDIALEVGYGSKSVFNSQFRKLTGLSPTAYRLKHRN